ncbi:MAG: peptidase T [Clostridium sp.]|nr:peptidase T [Clostridium sp.]
MDIIRRFTQYAQIDTQSDESSSAVPSTGKQFDLARLLVRQLTEMGASDVWLSDLCYVYARIPSNLSPEEDAATPRLGFLAHMDTSPSASGKDVKPRIVEKYDGGDIPLGSGTVLSPKTFPYLMTAAGSDLMVTDGTTLLGADDKAGIAEIMEMADILLKNPSIRHGEIDIAFTPDEEIGSGAEGLDLARFGAEVGYTVDGGPLGELEYENFNAASGTVQIRGVGVHPGAAKGKMVNASLLAMEFDSLLPPERPSNTEGYEGFYHLTDIRGDVSECRMHYIIRDHDRESFEKRKELFRQAGARVNERLSGTDAAVTVTVTDSYYNMREKIEPHMYLIDLADRAFRECGVTPRTVPVRGGTDGARLSFRGLPCPNLSTGGGNYHGIYEYLNLNSLRKMPEVLVRIAELFVRCRNQRNLTAVP